MAITPPRFHVDENVYFTSATDRRHNAVPTGRFVVVAVMPRNASGIHQYRVQPADRGPLRLVTELELRR
jgi:hypothetical protein